MSTPAGWYPDPQAEGQQRYWDGNAWTEHQAPLVQPQQPTQPTQPAEPAWTAPTQGAPYASGVPLAAKQKKPFWRRTWVLVTAAAVVVLGVIGAASGSGDTTDPSANGSHNATAQRDKTSDTVAEAPSTPDVSEAADPSPLPTEHAGADKDERAGTFVNDEPGAGHRLGQGLPGLLGLLADRADQAAVVEVR